MSRNRVIARLCMTTALAGAGTGAPSWSLAQSITVESGKSASAADIKIIGEEANEVESVLFEADSLVRDVADGPIIAEGNVSAYFGERYLRADKLIYDPATDIVIAEGNVAITDRNLETVFAGRVELTGDLRDGIVENFSALLQENARIAADSAIREQGAKTKFRKAVYTACDVCSSKGEEKTPTWRIKSLRVTRNEELKVVRFYHAFFEIKGVPILYMPFIQGPDPTVERMSGFLAPDVGASSRLGFNFELPYYLAISNSQDATFFPKYTSKDGVLWQGEYRRRGASSYHVVSGGVINFDNTNEQEEGIPGVRWHYFGKGHQNLNDKWRLSYDFERVSDKTYLRRYNVTRRGDLRREFEQTRTNTLRSNARAEWRSGNHSLQINSYLFQGLRPNDDVATTPYVLPSVDYRYDFSDRLAGGRTSIRANTATLIRTGGVDTQRFTASAFWQRDIITPGGHRFNLFAEARADAYYFQDLDEGTETIAGAPGEENRFETRLAPTAGIEWSYPLARNAGGARLFLEPKVQLVASPARQNPVGILNEDSQSVEFDYAGLFDYNKSAGFDAFEDGQRINIGVAAAAKLQNGLSIEGEVGRQYRMQSTQAFDTSSGLGGTSSDIVGSLNVRYKSIVGIENRFRFDIGGVGLARAESRAFVRAGPVRGDVTYVRLRAENVAARREELTARGELFVNRNWSAGGSWRLNLETDQTIEQNFFINYRDECATFGVTYRRDRTQTTNLEPDNAILISFTLRSLVDNPVGSNSFTSN